jgi:hypothetical protein
MMNAPAERKAPERPDFEPDVITILDLVQKWIRQTFFGRIASGGGWRYRLVACMLLAYWWPY